MARYIILFDWTDQGIRNVADTVDRVQQATELFRERFGMAVEHVYWTAGRHDFVAIIEAPDDATLAAAMLALGRTGNVRSETLRAFDEEEMREILARMG